jgi:hypothetical protein
MPTHALNPLTSTTVFLSTDTVSIHLQLHVYKHPSTLHCFYINSQNNNFYKATQAIQTLLSNLTVTKTIKNNLSNPAINMMTTQLFKNLPNLGFQPRTPSPDVGQHLFQDRM